MKKNIMALAATAAIAVLSLGSCATINSGAALGDKAPIGKKLGEAKSTIYLGLWSSQGEQNTIKQAAAKSFLGFDFGAANNINTIHHDPFNMYNTVGYDLHGRRVANPTNGIYIVNGKKVLVK